MTVDHCPVRTYLSCNTINPLDICWHNETRISETIRNYNVWTEDQSVLAQRMYAINESVALLKAKEASTTELDNFF